MLSGRIFTELSAQHCRGAPQPRLTRGKLRPGRVGPPSRADLETQEETPLLLAFTLGASCSVWEPRGNPVSPKADEASCRGCGFMVPSAQSPFCQEITGTHRCVSLQVGSTDGIIRCFYLDECLGSNNASLLSPCCL